MGKGDVSQNPNVGGGGRRVDAPSPAPEAPQVQAPAAPDVPVVEAPAAPAAPAPEAPHPGKVFATGGSSTPEQVVAERQDTAVRREPPPRPADMFADARPRTASQRSVEPEWARHEQARRDADAAPVPAPSSPKRVFASGGSMTPAEVAPEGSIEVPPSPANAGLTNVEPTAAPEARVIDTPAPAPRMPSVEDLATPDQPGITDPLENVIPVPRAEPSKLPATQFRAAAVEQSAAASNIFGTSNVGTAIEAPLQADPGLEFDEVGVPAEMLFRAYQNPGSGLRELLAADPSIDPEQMMLPGYAIPRIIDFFHNNDIEAFTEKRPTVDEASAHKRFVRAGVAPGIRIHPMVGTIYNADFDGDTMKVSFDADAIAGAKDAMDFSISPDNILKIDPDWFAMAPWGDGTEGVRAYLFKLFQSETDTPLNLTDSELKGLTAAIEQSWSENPEAGLRSMLMWCRAIGDRLGPDGKRVTSRVLGEIYRTNKNIRIAAKAYEGIWARYGGPVLTDDVVSDTAAPFPGLVSEASAPANLYDLWAMLGTPIGTVEKKNQHFRLAAGIAKGARERMGLFDQRESEMLSQTAEDIVAKAMSGIDSFDESTRAVSDEARRMVLVAVGYPDVSSPEAFQSWMQRFVQEHNRVVYAFNSAAAQIRLDLTIAPYDDLSLPFIPTDDQVKQRQTMRTQFKNVFGGFTMGTVFGAKCPRGWEKVTVEEFVQTNRMTTLGTRETPFDTPEQFIGRLADLRTSFPRDFRDMLLRTDRGGRTRGTLADMMDGGRTKFFAIAERREKARKAAREKGIAYAEHALDQDLQAIAEAIYLMSPDVFYHLGMDSPDAFARTELGRKFITAKTPDQLGGVLFEAVARYRLAPIERYRTLYEQATTQQDRDYHLRALEHELNALASSSDTWGAIVRDGLEVVSRVLFADMPMSKKEAELNKLVKADPLCRKNQEKYEIAAELYARPKGRYATDRFSGDMGHTQLRKNLTAASRAVDNWTKANWDHFEDSVSKARQRHEKKGNLMPFLKFIAENPSELAVLEPWMIADAVLSSMEKTYSSSEKAKQEAEVNYIYSAVNNLINGGVWSDLAVGGDFGLGAIALDRFQDTPAILARLLSDPDFAITVYDGTGDILLTRAVLLGKAEPSEKDVWDWLEAHPRAAMALRRNVMTNTVAKTGFSWRSATTSLADTISSTEKLATNARSADKRAMRALADHPGFYAMVSLATQMSGKKRSQLRGPATETVGKVIYLLRSLSAHEVDTKAFVTDMMKAAGIDMARVEAVYAQGLAEGWSLSEAPAESVQDMEEFQLGQLRDRLAADLTKYSTLLADLEGVDPVPLVSPDTAARLFHFGDESTVRSYFDTIQVIGSSKTMISTAVNGAESKRNAGLMFLAQYIGDPCEAPDPEPISTLAFAQDWDKYEGRMARVGEEWMPVNEVTMDLIIESSTDGMVYIEDPASCADPLCPCRRHATADPSTNLSGEQTTALGRLLTIVRTLSSEGLNLKVKTLGDDGTDSIVKNRVFDVLANDTAQRVSTAYAQAGITGARLELAKALRANFEAMGYTDEMSDDDWANIAQVLIRVVAREDGTEDVKILSIGQLNALVAASIARVRNENPGGIDHDVAIAAAAAGLTMGVESTLSVESVLAGFRAAPENPNAAQPALVSQRQSSIGRNLELVERILAENPDVRTYTDTQLDNHEQRLIEQHPKVAAQWGDYAMAPGKRGPGTRRWSYRVVGVVDGTEAKGDVLMAVGFRNAWVVKADAPKAAEAIAKAYELGMTVLIEGQVTADVWKKVYAATGVIDEHQLVPLPEESGIVVPGGRSVLPMFDIRLNGANTTVREGAINAGTFHALPENVYFYFESLINEHSLSDSEFAACQSFVEGLRPKKTGEYRIPARTAFANLLASIRGKGVGYPNVRVATKEEIMADLLDPYVAEIASDAPTEFDKKITVDTGTIVDEGSRADLRLREGMRAYLARLGEAGEDGLLRDARPDDIIGWLRAEVGDQVAYHPIRPFEMGNASGAPASFEIDSVAYDTSREELVISWRHEGTMLGRSFKLFEALYAANKFMARSDAIPDIRLKNGVKLAGYIAKQSTASRRLFMRRQQKMMTLMYMARMEPFGYNLAEKPETFPNDPDLKQAMLTDPETASIGMWDERLRMGDIAFFPDAMADMNALCNNLARKAVRYGINPTVVFASRHNGVPSNIWFNFQVLFERGPVFQASLMKLLNYMMPSLVPAGLDDTAEGTLFNKDLQVLVPYTDGKVSGEQWVDLYGGFHFLDEHFTGHSGAGTAVRSDSLPTVNTLIAGGKRLSPSDIDRYLDWGNIGRVNQAASPNWMLPDTTEEID